MERKDEKKVPPTSNKKCITYNLIKACITTLLLFLMLVSIAGAATTSTIEEIIKPGTILEGRLYQLDNSNEMRISITSVEGNKFSGTIEVSGTVELFSINSYNFHSNIYGIIDPNFNTIAFQLNDPHPNQYRVADDYYVFNANLDQKGYLRGKWARIIGIRGFLLGEFYVQPRKSIEEPEYTPTEEPEYIPTEEPEYTPTEKSKKSSASVDLYGEKTEVFKGEDIQLKLSAVNLITNPTMHVQVIIIPPSGMSVSSSDFVVSGAGQFTTTYDLEPGKGKDIEVRIAANQVGNFDVKGRVVYYFGEDKKHAKDHPLNLSIKVFANSTIPTPTPTDKKPFIPGLGATSLIFILIFVFLLRKK